MERQHRLFCSIKIDFCALRIDKESLLKFLLGYFGSATYRVYLRDITFCFVELACWRRSVNRGHTLHRR